MWEAASSMVGAPLSFDFASSFALMVRLPPLAFRLAEYFAYNAFFV